MNFLKKSLTCAFVLAAFFMAGCRQKDNSMKNGEYFGTGDGRSGPITVSIKVNDNKITGIKIISQAESDFAQPAIKVLTEGVLNGTNPKKLDAVSGATLTSKGFKKALVSASDSARGIVEKPKHYKDTKCDVVVIGSGGAGLSAAVEAASGGAKVIVLEKMGIAGGNTNYSTGGINASESSVQKKLGIQDSNEQFFKDTIKGGHYLNDEELVRVLVENSAAAVDWLISLGADLSDVGKMAGASNPRTHRPKGGAPIGSHLVSVLSKAAADRGVEVRLKNKVTGILEVNDRAAGVIVESLAGTYVIEAGSVVIATGGFGANMDMLSKFNVAYRNFGTTNHPGATGDGIKLAEKFNADTLLMEKIQTHPTVAKESGMMITEAVRGNGAILVNLEGERFVNEMETRDVVSGAILNQLGKTAFLVFDQGVRDSLKAIDLYSELGILKSAQTPKELASRLGVNVAGFEQTLTRYNAFQKSGNDSDFGRKGSEMPAALESAPYYGCEVAPAVHHTMGGLKIDTEARVLNRDGKPVEGLFAAGEVTGGVHGDNRLGGNSVSDIIVFGRIAGRSAVKNIKK